MPKGVEWIRLPAIAIDPERRAITLGDGDTIAYRVLIVAPGLRLAWEKIAGLPEAFGRNGVTSNYRYDLAPYTCQLVQELQRGRALFSQPPMPIKCAGAPQKAMYLSCDIWRERCSSSDRRRVSQRRCGAVRRRDLRPCADGICREV
jgi:sulfide:quinone oxidoreductase